MIPAIIAGGPGVALAAQPLPATPSREQICALERELLKLPQQSIPVTHYFAPGLYARRIDIPATATLTGKIHRFGHLNILAAGEIIVWTEEGMRHLVAPAVIVSQPGIKRAGHALTDCTWITVHATEQTDPDAAELELIEPEDILIEATASVLEAP
jgi:quercetin dioxygenase-like cupin family protein